MVFVELMLMFFALRACWTLNVSVPSLLIAALVGWGPNRWDHFDAGSRSSFYVRLFAGLIAAEVDMMIDHNCISHKEKGYCWQPNCGYSLGIYRWNGKF